MTKPTGRVPGHRFGAVRTAAAKGFLYGHRQRTVVLDFPEEEVADAAATIEAIGAALEPLLPPLPEAAEPAAAAQQQAGRGWLIALAELVARLEEAAGGVVCEGATLRKRPGTPTAAPGPRLALPSSAPSAAITALITLDALAERHTEGGLSAEEVASAVTRLCRAAAGHVPQESSTVHLLRKAHFNDLPITMLASGVILIGYGTNGHRFLASLSEQTSAIAALLAKDKRSANRLLAMAGLPVAEQQAAPTLEKVKAAAETIGYPVVVKPADQDKGLGVTAGIETEAELESAFAAAAKFSTKILVERFVPGTDFRINVVRGRVTGVIMRRPASVTGDGLNTIEAPVAEQNVDPRRGTGTQHVMRPITLDEEADFLLARAGLTRESVVPSGTKVALRRIANLSGGGSADGVLDQIHPENAALAIDATRIIGLDIAGVDLIVPDIALSWRETGGIICEVNGMPQIGLTYPEVFDHLLLEYAGNASRFPLAVVLTDAPLPADWPTDTPFKVLQQPSFDAIRAALIDPATQGLVIATDAAPFRGQGLPMDRIETLAIGPNPWASDQLQQRLASLTPYLRGSLIVDAAANHGRALRRTDTPILEVAGGFEGVLDTVIRELSK